MTNFLMVLVTIYAFCHFLFIAPQYKFIQDKDLVRIRGTLQYLEMPTTSKNRTATLQLNEISGKSFLFNISGHYASHKINKEDSVSILALKDDLQRSLNKVRAYELLKGDKPVFTVSQYNSSLHDSFLLLRIVVWMAIGLIVLYLLIERTNFVRWIKKQLDSPDPGFKPPGDEPNFNEFLDR